jgi:hypothetical protein
MEGFADDVSGPSGKGFHEFTFRIEEPQRGFLGWSRGVPDPLGTSSRESLRDVRRAVAS